MLVMTDSQQLTHFAQQLSLMTGMAVDLVASIASTNSALLEGAVELPPHPQAPAALMALTQTAGRGRRGKDWLNTAATSHSVAPAFMASLGLRSYASLPSLGLLPLHIGVAVTEQLRAWGCPAGLKWPNDIVIDTPAGSAKLGGILVETRAIDGANAIVMGMGLNWHSAPQLGGRLTAGAAQFAPAAPEALDVCAALLHAMRVAWQRTVQGEACRFADFDALYGKAITAQGNQNTLLHGIAKGINAQGHLGLQTESELIWLHSGEVSVRAVA
jgi:BirA family biotin operon repressor/biotin-[acetyl-CoA-carboxylase] ligase